MKNKSVVVTGACGGIGRALVEEFKKANYQVIATDQKSSEESENLNCDYYFTIDLERTVNDKEYATDVFSKIASVSGTSNIHVLVNNAAVQILGGVESLTAGDWKKTLDVNLVAPFIWTQGLLNQLKRDQGSVINISSIHARLTKRNFVAYSTSKAALSGMTRAMAIDLGDKVRVNAIEPAAIETEMLVAGFDSNPEGLASLKEFHPLARIGRASEVAKLAVFLAENSVGFTHGATLSVDGGIGGRLYDPV